MVPPVLRLRPARPRENVHNVWASVGSLEASKLRQPANANISWRDAADWKSRCDRRTWENSSSSSTFGSSAGSRPMLSTRAAAIGFAEGNPFTSGTLVTSSSESRGYRKKIVSSQLG